MRSEGQCLFSTVLLLQFAVQIVVNGAQLLSTSLLSCTTFLCDNILCCRFERPGGLNERQHLDELLKASLLGEHAHLCTFGTYMLLDLPVDL
jgi:hypothetical protein